jgi:hypothetical protein
MVVWKFPANAQASKAGELPAGGSLLVSLDDCALFPLIRVVNVRLIEEHNNRFDTSFSADDLETAQTINFAELDIFDVLGKDDAPQESVAVS